MAKEFFKKHFPPHKVQQVKRRIASFVQGENETLYQALERYKDLFMGIKIGGWLAIFMKDLHLGIDRLFNSHAERTFYKKN